MLSFALTTNKTKLVAVTGSLKAMMMATWMTTDEMTAEEQEKMWKGYIKLPFGYAKYGNSMLNFFPPFINPVDDYSVDPLFVYNLLTEGHLFLPLSKGVTSIGN
jgi:hypothetical protein